MTTSAPEKTTSYLEDAPGSWLLRIIPTVHHCPSLLTLRIRVVPLGGRASVTSIFVSDRWKPLTNPGPLVVVYVVVTLDLKSPDTFASKIAGVGSVVETSHELVP